MSLCRRFGLLFGTVLVSTLATVVPTSAQNTALPMTIATGEGMFSLTVPDTDTTRSAYGGKLRVYDVHIAKMVEVTHHFCSTGRLSPGTTWTYTAGNGSISMGNFQISCRLASDLATAYGLGRMERTTILSSNEEGGSPSRRVGGIQILNITGAKVDRWMNFTRNFRPVQ